MNTDGGGYMLFGRTNTSVTWTVPSSNDAVEPYGNPHWASHLGDAPILDLRIQMAHSKIVILILRKKILVSSKKLLETSKIILVSIVRILF